MSSDEGIDTGRAPGAFPAEEPSVGAAKASGRWIVVSSFDLSASLLQSVVDKDTAFAIDQQQFPQTDLAIDVPALTETDNLMPGGDVPPGPNPIIADEAARMIDLSSKGMRRSRPSAYDFSVAQACAALPDRGKVVVSASGGASDDERVEAELVPSRLMRRHKLRAIAGVILVRIFFATTAHGLMLTLSGLTTSCRPPHGRASWRPARPF